MKFLREKIYIRATDNNGFYTYADEVVFKDGDDVDVDNWEVY